MYDHMIPCLKKGDGREVELKQIAVIGHDRRITRII